MTMPSASVSHLIELEPPRYAPILPDQIAPPPSRWGLPEWFAIAQVAGPALLYLPGTQRLRVPLRFGVFALSLMGLVWVLRSTRVAKTHPSWKWLVAAAAYMAIMVFHPTTNTYMAGLAQLGMHLAVVAPLFWAPRYFRGDSRRLARVLTILWALNGAGVVVGILQVRDPARWMPAEFTSNMSSRLGLAMYQYRAADGTMAVRPPGLGDAPGAACNAGQFVAVMGLAYLGLPVSLSRKLLGLAMALAGVVVIFLTHVRSSLLLVLGCAAIYLIMMVMQGRLRTVLMVGCGIAVCGAGSLFYAQSMGGRSTVDRFATLLSDDPLKVYEKSARMGMVTGAFDTLLVDYPLGAGLGRWGMMRAYFGDEDNLDSPSVWAEVQFASWILDGGIVLLSLYLVALAVAGRRVARSTFLHRSPQVRQWGAVIAMLSIGPVVTMFSYVPFYSQMGMQFWFLIGAYEGLAQGDEPLPPPVRRNAVAIP